MIVNRLKSEYRQRFPRPWPRPIRDEPPPRCPPGWTTGPPDFVGVGVQRCATTRWFRLIRLHPEVAKAPGARKELHYFDRFSDGAPPADIEARYHAYFPRPPERITGEWTPRYIHDFWTPPLLHRAAPDAKLLVLLRDPVARFRSGVAFHYKNSAPRHPIVVSDAVGRGFYFNQLQRLLRTFPQEQVLVLQTERCNVAPNEQLRDTYAFLGIDPTFTPAGIDRVVHAAAAKKPDFDDEQIRQLVATYEPDVAALAGRFASIDLSLWPHFAHLA